MMEKERLVKCAGCGRMKPPVIFISGMGEIKEFCSCKCREDYEQLFKREKSREGVL